MSESIPSSHGEQVVAVAIRYHGTQYVGKAGENHSALMGRIAREENLPALLEEDVYEDKGFEDGFATSSGVFLTREEAMEVAIKSNQVYQPEDSLDSTNIDLPGMDPKP